MKTTLRSRRYHGKTEKNLSGLHYHQLAQEYFLLTSPSGDRYLINMRLFDHLGLAFFLGIILPSCSQVRVMANLTTIVYSSVPTSQSPTHILTTLESQETTTYTTQTSTSESTATVRDNQLTETPTPTALQLSSTLPTEGLPSSSALASTDPQLSTLGEDLTKSKPCEENYKQQMLICLIIIGVLAFICVSLLLVIVVMASKLSYQKRKQPNKRFPRSNGDFLSTNSLWPIGLETLQRLSTENPKPRGLSLERQGQGQNGDEVNKKLVSEIADRQKQKEMSENTYKTIITTVEI